MKDFIKNIVPQPFLRAYRNWVIQRGRKQNSRKNVGDVFTEIYVKGQWGKNERFYCSGSGSSEHHANLYAELIRGIAREKRISTILDLGCGDFTVGAKMQLDAVRYIGVDVVEGLIRYNRDRFGTDNIEFMCLDIIAAELPDADLCLIRQVLQHLSNSQISAVLQKIKKYRYTIITEHYPAPCVEIIPNRDKPHGPDTRILDNSGVYLDREPYSLDNLQMILEVDATTNILHEGEKIRSFLIDQTPDYNNFPL